MDSARAKHYNVYSRSYVEVYRGKIGGKHHFLPQNCTEFPPNPPPTSSVGNFGHVAVA